MDFAHKKIEEIRKEYDIKDDVIAYKMDEEMYKKLTEVGELTEIFNSCWIDNKETDKEKFEHYNKCSTLTHKSFFAVSFQASNDFNDEYIILFTKEIDKIYDKYLKGKCEAPKPYTPAPGVYRPEKTMTGWKLEPMPVNDTEAPILNDDYTGIINREIEAFLKNEHTYKEIKADYKRGIMLYGAPGNGKTTFIKTLLKGQKEAISVLINSDDGGNMLAFMEYFMKLPSVKDKLKIVVFEDIDGMRASYRSLLLNFLDGVLPINKTIFIATTNYPDAVDKALTERPSRFDSIFKIDCPNSRSRGKLLKTFFPNLKDKDMEDCVKASKNFNGAFFKEFFLFSRLNGMAPLNTIKEITRRRELCK